MDIIFQPDLIKKIEKHAVQSYPNECCGMLFGLRRKNDLLQISDIKEAENRTAGSTAASFEIDPIKIYKAEQEYKEKGLEILGFYHSHPDKKAILSERDIKGMIPGLVYVIISLTKKSREDIEAYVLTDFAQNGSKKNAPTDLLQSVIRCTVKLTEPW